MMHHPPTSAASRSILGPIEPFGRNRTNTRTRTRTRTIKSISGTVMRTAPERTPNRRTRYAALLVAATLALGGSSLGLPSAAAAGTPNSKPFAASDLFTYKQQNNLYVSAPGVLANDTDADGDKLSAQLVSNPSHGTLNGFWGDGAFSYIPYSHSFLGYDTFTYRVWDGTDWSLPNTVTIYAKPSNEAPVAQPDYYSVIENGTLSVSAPGLLSNDGDPDGDGVTISYLASNPKYGTLSGPNIIGHFVYTPKPGFVGIDTFTYAITDGKLASVPATVSIHVMALKAIPHSDAFTVQQDHVLDVASPGLLKNDVEPNGYPMTIADITQQPKHGAVLWYLTTGGFHYVPNPGFSGTDSFSYMVKSDNQLSAPAVATITVKPNLKPVAHNDSFKVTKNHALTVKAPGLVKNDTDPENSKLSVKSWSNPAHGTLSKKSPTGGFVYTPKKNFVGSDRFAYRVSDGKLSSAKTATVTLTVK